MAPAQSEETTKAASPRIPVRNLWLLMLYACECKLGARKLDAAFEESPEDIPELAAEVLTELTAKRLQRSLYLHYQAKKAQLSRLRGRIDLLATERFQLLKRGKVFCSFFEMNVDTPRYRYVRYALEKIAALLKAKDSQALANTCRSLAQSFKAAGRP